MKNTKVKIFVTIIMISFCIVMFFPFYMMLATSVKSMKEIMSSNFTIIPKKFFFSNYAAALSKGTWGIYFFNSVIITIAETVISLIINSVCGYALARLTFKGRDWLFKLFLVGLMMPPQSIMLQTFLIIKKLPLLGGNDILGNGGIGLVNTQAGIIIPMIAGSFGVFLCRQFYLSFPKELDDAATIDGLGKLGTYISIYIPLSKPLLATLAIFKATAAWNDYVWPLIMTNNPKLYTVQLALTNFKTEVSVEWNYLMAATTLIVLPLTILFLLMQKYYVEGITFSGIKG